MAVAVDPAIAAGEVARLAARAAELGAPVAHVLVTHADWDHVCGLAAFPAATATMGAATAARLAGGEPAARIAQRAEEYGLQVAGERAADRVLEPGLAYRVGPFAVETLALCGHTPDGTAYRIRALDLLAVGDHLSPVEFPFASSTAAYRQTLAGLVNLLRYDPPGRVFPGHGHELTAAEALAIAEADLAYLHALRAAVAGALGAGAGRDAAQAAGLAVPVPRGAADDLETMHPANVEAQLEEQLPA